MTTYAVLSTTDDPLYKFYLPIVVYCWNKLDIPCIIFKPRPINNEKLKIDSLQLEVKMDIKLQYRIEHFDAPEDKQATYSQCSRLFACALDIPGEWQLVTSDIDMAVFDDRFNAHMGEWIGILGNDLVPTGQYPMCYIWGSVKSLRAAFKTEGKIPQQCLDDLLGSIECEHFRGNYWGKDQETAYNALAFGNSPVMMVPRSNGQNQFATKRADRDSWFPPFGDIIDSHLPRPGFTEDNFMKILDLLQEKFPDDGFGWLIDYKNKFIKLI